MGRLQQRAVQARSRAAWNCRFLLHSRVRLFLVAAAFVYAKLWWISSLQPINWVGGTCLDTQAAVTWSHQMANPDSQKAKLISWRPHNLQFSPYAPNLSLSPSTCQIRCCACNTTDILQKNSLSLSLTQLTTTSLMKPSSASRVILFCDQLVKMWNCIAFKST